jgi:hypothetical protein
MASKDRSYACVVTQHPSGTGTPAARRRASAAALPPTKERSVQRERGSTNGWVIARDSN